MTVTKKIGNFRKFTKKIENYKKIEIEKRLSKITWNFKNCEKFDKFQILKISKNTKKNLKNFGKDQKFIENLYKA